MNELFPILKDKDKTAELLRNNVYVGIDFGTSNTVISVCRIDPEEGYPVLSSLKLDSIDGERTHLIPSVIFLNSNNRILIGQTAKAQGLRDGKLQRNYLSSFKMELGEESGSKYHQFELARNEDKREAAISSLAALAIDEEDSAKIAESMKIDSPKMAAQAFFMTLKLFIDKHCNAGDQGKKINYSVSIPASFESSKRRDYRDALTEVGIDVTEQFFVDEPNAAFLAWLSEEDGAEHLFSHRDTARVLVFDFGAGTCDISLLEARRHKKSGLTLKNLALSKFSRLGGDDLDHAIALKVLFPRICSKNDIDPDTIPEHVYRQHIELKLKLWAEKLKVKASRKMHKENVDDDAEVTVDTNSATLTFPEVHPTFLGNIFGSRTTAEMNVPEELALTFGDFNECVNLAVSSWNLESAGTREPGFLRKIWSRMFSSNKDSCLQLLEDTLRKTGSEDAGVDYVLLTGGSSNLPQVEEALGEHFGEEVEIIVPKDMQSYVSKGVALHSFLARGLGENPITEILAEDIRILTKEGEKILFKAGTEIPETQKIAQLYPRRKRQRTLEIPFLAGEKRRVVDKLDGKLPRAVDEKTEIHMEAHVDQQKILQVHGWYENAEDGNKYLIFRDEVISPYARETTTEYEGLVGRAENEFNNTLLGSGFVEGQSKLGCQAISLCDKLIDIHNEHGNHGECLRLYERYQPTEYVSMDFHSSHDPESTSDNKYAELAYENKQNGVTAWNLAVKSTEGSDDWCRYMKEAALEHDEADAKFKWGKHIEDDDPQESEKMIGEAFAHFKSLFDDDPEDMEEEDYKSLIRIARYLGDEETLPAAIKAQEKSTRLKGKKQGVRFNERNLLSSSDESDGSGGDEEPPVIKLRGLK